MKNVIEKYKKGIFVYVLLNCFALVVNLFQINIHTEQGSNTTYYFTHRILDDSNKLWPLVNFNYESTEGYKISGFNGIFYQYDWSEFLLYIGLLVVFLVYKAYIVTPKTRVPGD